MRLTIELIYAPDCPNVELARRQLSQALAAAGSDAAWQEWDRESKDIPPYARGYGSPTILVNGRDVAGQSPGGADCCRLYATEEGSLKRAPSVKIILDALRSRLPIADCSNDFEGLAEGRDVRSGKRRAPGIQAIRNRHSQNL